MKKLTVFTAMLMLVVVLASCGKDNYKSFIGTWGVERIDYYNIDYAGNPIEASVETFYFTPGDMNNGIDLVFREDKTGEMRDRSRDTLKFDYDTVSQTYQTIIVCPDTTLVTRFTFSYNADDGLLFMNLQTLHPIIYQMRVKFYDDDTFVYENEYETDYVEKARLVRYSTETRGDKSKPVSMKRHPKSLFSNY